MLQYTERYLNDLEDACVFLGKSTELVRKRILITGSGGLICSALVDVFMMLNNKYNYEIEVYAAGRVRERICERFKFWINNPRFHFLQYDALKPIDFEEVFDYIVHGASPANPSLYSSHPVETMMCNVVGINNILDLAKKNMHGRVIFISSSEVYGKKREAGAYREDEYCYLDFLNPRACYPSSKRAAETLCASYMKEYNVDYVIARPGHVYGPTMTDSDDRASSQFPREVKKGNNIVMKSSGNQLRSYCYVIDCATAIITILLKGISGEAYNISNSHSIVSIREMAEAFAREAGKEIIFDVPSSEEKQSYNLMDNSSLDSSKLEQLGWNGLFDLTRGVISTLDAIE